MEENNKEFTLEDILEEQRRNRDKSLEESLAEESLPNGTVSEDSILQGSPSGIPNSAGSNITEERAGASVSPNENSASGYPDSSTEPVHEYQVQDEKSFSEQDQTADINMYATGNVYIEDEYREKPDPKNLTRKERKELKKQEKLRAKQTKKNGRLFGKNKKPDYTEENELFYGIQRKPIDEYRQGYDSPTGELFYGEEGYALLFDDSKKALDDEVEKNFDRLQQERRSRVQQAAETSGMDEDQIADEFGIVAPMPITSFTSDPYLKQHGLETEGQEGFQQAMMHTASDHTMEIKLNVLNSTVELQNVNDAAVGEDTISKVLDSAPTELNEPNYQEQVHVPSASTSNSPRGVKSLTETPPVEEPEHSSIEYVSIDTSSHESSSPTINDEVTRIIQEPIDVTKKNSHRNPKQRTKPLPDDEKPAPLNTSEPIQKTASARTTQSGSAKSQAAEATRKRKRVAPPAPLSEMPQIEHAYEYRTRGVPYHIIHAQVILDKLSEGNVVHENLADPVPNPANSEPVKSSENASVQSTVRNFISNIARKRKTSTEEKMHDFSAKKTADAIEDYTGPTDEKVIAAELKGDMHDLSLRITLTAICTAVLAVANIFFSRQFAGTSDPGPSSIVYIVVTLAFLAIAVGACFRTILNGFKALVSFSPNSDSGIAIAAIAVITQTIGSFFFWESLADSAIHLYAVVLTAILFINAIGKLTLIRRIHSNFRFITSKEQKYNINIFNDHNTALKMTKETVMENPVIAYQSKTGFLRRFLEMSYAPDPAEAASQVLAPIGLVSSLVLCIVVLLITGSVPTAISAFAAACCACTAVSNMIAVNLPMSKLCKVARRAGAMVVGYEGVKRMGNVNSVMMDADDIFPRGTVLLNGIRTFGQKSQAGDTIMMASALMNEIGGPLCGVFDQVISENEDSLPKVGNIKLEDGFGIIGQVDGKRIYIGNRDLMQRNRIQCPPKEEETKHANSNKQVIYIAVDMTVTVMMILTYSADRKRQTELQRLEENGISIVVRTTDVNVDQKLISSLFGIDAASISILDSGLGYEYKKLADREAVSSDAVVATKGRVESMMSVVSSCVNNKRLVNLIVVLQNIAMILTFVLVAFLACFGALKILSSILLFAFQLVWLLIIVVVPKLKNH